MSDFVTLSCPNCGGKLQITNDLERFACSYCGTEQIVRRSGGIIALAPIVYEISKVKAGVDKTAAELAIKRLKEEINDLQNQYSTLYSERSSSTTGLVIVGLGVFLLGGATFWGGITDPNFNSILIGLVLFGIGVFLGYRVYKLRKILDAKQTYILSSAKKKKNEMEKLKNIVDS